MSHECSPIFVFGSESLMYDCQLSSRISYLGDISHLRGHYECRFIKWQKQETMEINLNILAKHDIDSVILRHHNFSPRAIITVEVRDKSYNLMGRQVYNKFADIHGLQKPLGIWKVGIDVFAGARDDEVDAWDTDMPFWFDFNQYPAIIPKTITIKVEDPLNPVSGIRLSNVAIGKRVTLNNGISWGHKYRPISSGAITELANAKVARSKNRHLAKTFSFNLDFQDNPDSEKLQRWDRKYKDEPVFVSGMPFEPSQWRRDQYTFMGEWETSPEYAGNHFNMNGTSLTLREVS